MEIVIMQFNQRFLKSSTIIVKTNRKYNGELMNAITTPKELNLKTK